MASRIDSRSFGDVPARVVVAVIVGGRRRRRSVVGGSCFESPATTACRPRASAGMASAGRIWLASSNTTTSKYGLSDGSSWETTSGLITQHGLEREQDVRARFA